MKFEKRIRALEARFHSDLTILHLPDGSVERICGPGDYLRDLFAGALGGAELTPAQAADLKLIRSAVRFEEPGGGHMFELIGAIMNSPA
jgi:hypothetical protein